MRCGPWGTTPTQHSGAGISVARNYIMTMAICGVFAGLAASIDVLGWQFQVSSADISTSQVGFLGIAVALLGRNTALGTVFAALLFGALETGTSPGNINSTTLNPELAPQLTFVIEGLVVLLVSTDLIAIRLLGLPRKLGWGGPEPGANLAQELEPDDPSLDAAEALRPEPGTMTTVTTPPPAPTALGSSLPVRRIGIAALVLAAIAWILTLPPIMARTAVPSMVLGLVPRPRPVCSWRCSRSIDAWAAAR